MWVWGNPEMGKPGEHTSATFAQASPAQRARLLGVPNVVLAGHGLPNDRLSVHFSADGIHWNEAARRRPTGDRTTAFSNPFRQVWGFSLREYSGTGRNRQTTRLVEPRASSNAVA